MSAFGGPPGTDWGACQQPPGSPLDNFEDPPSSEFRALLKDFERRAEEMWRAHTAAMPTYQAARWQDRPCVEGLVAPVPVGQLPHIQPPFKQLQLIPVSPHMKLERVGRGRNGTIWGQLEKLVPEGPGFCGRCGRHGSKKALCRVTVGSYMGYAWMGACCSSVSMGSWLPSVGRPLVWVGAGVIPGLREGPDSPPQAHFQPPLF